MDKLVEIYGDVDDFCRIFMPEWEKMCLTDGTRKCRRSNRMTMSDMMTLIILFHHSHTRDFKHFYLGSIQRFLS